MKVKGLIEDTKNNVNNVLENNNKVYAGALGAMLLLSPVPTLIGVGAAYFLNKDSGHILPKATAAAGVCTFIAGSVPTVMTLCTVASVCLAGKFIYDNTKPFISNLTSKVHEVKESVYNTISNISSTDTNIKDKVTQSTPPVYFI